ncbi:class I SAM-dependent methyltransferase [Paraflavitalea pollutisoli]|uniref:class I SAM-dependent methyltransferase n=1 Tax=Paraflavitalea pollutisoli TaxID=3034143 RepID=UPI0023EC514E|nr:class I SAM-dependent methyltransferase [Paraflavitalea sp. H1-2-19X]
MKRVLKSGVLQRISDVVLSPVTLISAIWFKFVSSTSPKKMPLSESIFMKVGVLPIKDHYYQPLINPNKHLSKPLNDDRPLPGIEWNVREQLNILQSFDYNTELAAIPRNQKDVVGHEYYYNNHSFCPGDGEFLYNMIRHFKPRRIIEIGCGYSTMMAVRAEKKNAADNVDHACQHTCIEPYEMPWLEQLDVQVIRKKVEDVDKEIFTHLEANDILFIDSSHMIRPQGDVLFEFLEVLPILKKGVIVHVHDIFSPRDYPKEWIIDNHCMWNEQYLLEAFLMFNTQFRIIGALNFLKHHHRQAFDAKCPNSGAIGDDEPGSFWMIRH